MSHREQAEKHRVHKARHLKLHHALDELIADFILHVDKWPSETTLFELMQWSYQQTIEPTEKAKQT
jgi:hypothetical protein